MDAEQVRASYWPPLAADEGGAPKLYSALTPTGDRTLLPVGTHYAKDGTRQQAAPFADLHRLNADLQAAQQRREESLVGNAERYSTWLCGRCVDERMVEVGYVPRVEELLEAKLEGASISMLLMLSVYPRAEVAYAASQALWLRYLAAHGVQS